MPRQNQVQQFANVMATGLARRASEPAADVWPAPRADLTLGDLHSAPILLPRLAEAFSRVGDIREMARAFHRPSRPSHLMYLFLQEPDSQVEGQQRVDTANRLLDVIGALRSGDTFASLGTNLVLHDWADVAARMSGTGITPAQARLSGVLSSALSTYCEYLYFAHLAYGREIHGPYPIGDSRTLVVRDYYDLSPPHWEFPKSLPFSSLTLYLITRDVEYTFDFAGRMTANRAIPQNLEALLITIDGREVSMDDVPEIVPPIMSAISAAKNESLALSEGQLLLQWVRGQFWAARPAFALSGMNEDWKLPPELVRRLETSSGPSWLTARFAKLAARPLNERVAELERLFSPDLVGK